MIRQLHHPSKHSFLFFARSTLVRTSSASIAENWPLLHRQSSATSTHGRGYRQAVPQTLPENGCRLGSIGDGDQRLEALEYP